MKRSAFDLDADEGPYVSSFEGRADFSRNDPVLPDNELVLLHGPPMSGKSRYFAEKLAPRGFIRVSAEELFRADDKLNLRGVAKKVVELLKTGVSVCVDDGNMKLETRKVWMREKMFACPLT